VVALSDVNGAVRNPAGFDMREVTAWVAAKRTLQGLPGAESITQKELLTADVTVLVPAALENQIDGAIAREARCRVIVEGANGPTLPEADAILAERGILLVPDILANAGGVLVSYFEWVQDLHSFFWEEADINQKLEKLMTRAYGAVSTLAAKHGWTLRQAAYTIAVDKVAQATMVRGIYP
jgi:glutamate dehydrogenase (NAD(P)+)